MTGGSYIDVFQVQGVQILTVSPPQYRRPPLPRDGTSQHGALANRHSGNTHFLVIREVEQVHICWREGRMTQLDEEMRTGGLIQWICWPQFQLFVRQLFINVHWYCDGFLKALKSEVTWPIPMKEFMFSTHLSHNETSQQEQTVGRLQ